MDLLVLTFRHKFKVGFEIFLRIKMAHVQLQSESELEQEKLFCVISYLTIVGWLIALIYYGRHKGSCTRFHLKQSIGLIITCSIFAFIPLIGWVLNVFLVVCWLIAIVHLFAGRNFLVPIVGNFYQEHFDFI